MGLYCLIMFFGVEAVADEECQDHNTTAIRNLNLKLLDDPRVDISLIPIGDGLTIARKK